MSSHALTMSPKAYDLFSAAIFESGTMLAVKEKYGYSRTHRGSLAVADYFNCSSSSYDQEMLGCLQVRKFSLKKSSLLWVYQLCHEVSNLHILNFTSISKISLIYRFAKELFYFPLLDT